MSMDYDEALDKYWGMTKKERDAIDIRIVTGKQPHY